MSAPIIAALLLDQDTEPSVRLPYSGRQITRADIPTIEAIASAHLDKSWFKRFDDTDVVEALADAFECNFSNVTYIMPYYKIVEKRVKAARKAEFKKQFAFVRDN